MDAGKDNKPTTCATLSEDAGPNGADENCRDGRAVVQTVSSDKTSIGTGTSVNNDTPKHESSEGQIGEVTSRKALGEPNYDHVKGKGANGEAKRTTVPPKPGAQAVSYYRGLRHNSKKDDGLKHSADATVPVPGAQSSLPTKRGLRKNSEPITTVSPRVLSYSTTSAVPCTQDSLPPIRGLRKKSALRRDGEGSNERVISTAIAATDPPGRVPDRQQQPRLATSGSTSGGYSMPAPMNNSTEDTLLLDNDQLESITGITDQVEVTENNSTDDTLLLDYGRLETTTGITDRAEVAESNSTDDTLLLDNGRLETITTGITDRAEVAEEPSEARRGDSGLHETENRSVLDLHRAEALATARLISASEFIVPDIFAVEVDPQELEQKSRRKKQDQRKLMIACVFVTIFVLALIIYLSVALTGKEAEDLYTSVPISTTPPTYLPTLAPTVMLSEFIFSLPITTQDSLNYPTSVQFRALEWLLEHPDLANMPRWRQTQLFALATFFYAFEGPQWPEKIKNDWMLYDKSECNWFSSGFGEFDNNGIFRQFEMAFVADLEPCTKLQHFQSIQLPGLNLSMYHPYFPPELQLLTSLREISLPGSGINASLKEFLLPLTNLSKLESLEMDQNHFFGTIPSEIGLMSNLIALLLGGIPIDLETVYALVDSFAGNSDQIELLKLYLDSLPNNFISGTLPTEMFSLSNLINLDVSNSQVSGTIPSDIGKLSKVGVLVFTSNLLSGRLPTEIGLLTDMIGLYLRSNFLSGSLVSELGNFKELQSFDISINEISGTIPTEIFKLQNLTNFYATRCSLWGSVATEIGLLTKMTGLAATHNQLSGRLPTELGLLTDMEVLALDNNILSGSIPELQLPKLRNLTLSSNILSGTIPSSLPRYLTNISSLFLQQNMISSTIPTEIGLMTTMEWLFLSNNLFDGPLPSTLGLLTNLTIFHLFDLNLNQSLPSELGLLTAISHLTLSKTSITGTIPTEFALMTQMSSLVLANNILSLQIPTELFEITSLTILALNGNQFQGTISTKVGELTMLELLQLGENSLSGTLPSEIGSLSNSFSLRFGSNSISGTIPESLQALTKLEILEAHNNILSGPVPTQVGLLSNLKELSLYDNLLNGIPTELGLLASLYWLDLEINPVSASIPSEVGLLLNLEFLLLSNANMFGTMPEEMTVNLTNLKLLYLNSNLFSGYVPSELGLWTHLTYLNLANNSFSGTLPSEIALLNSSLVNQLDISNNFDLVGQLPDELCSLGKALIFSCTSTLCGCTCTCGASFNGTNITDDTT